MALTSIRTSLGSLCPSSSLQLTSLARKVAMLRKTMIDMRLLDGTLIPAGTLMATSQYAVHHDERHYPNPKTFDPSR